MTSCESGRFYSPAPTRSALTPNMLPALHIMASGARGGGADHLLGLLPALAQQGARVMALVGDDGPLAEELAELGIAVRSASLMGSRLGRVAGQMMFAHAHSQGAGVLHLHGTRAASLAATAAFGQRDRFLPRVYHAHGLATSQVPHRSWRFGLRLAGEALACFAVAGVLSVCEADRDALVRWRLVAEREAIHVPNATRLIEHPVSKRRQHSCSAPFATRKSRAAVGLPQDCPLVGTVARLVPQKDIVTLLNAVWGCPGVHLAVVGDGPQRQLCVDHPLCHEGRLHLLGTRNDIPAILAALDAFVLSSRWEGEPVVLLEAMAAGIPWVATATAGARELARLAPGLLVPIGDHQALGSAISRLLARGHWARELSSAGREAVKARNHTAQALQVLAAYRKLGLVQASGTQA